MQIIAAIGGIVGSVYGARSVGAKLMRIITEVEVKVTKIETKTVQIEETLKRDYVTLESHRASMTTLHADKNKLADEVAYLKGESAAKKTLDERQSEEIAFLKAIFLSRNTEPPKV